MGIVESSLLSSNNNLSVITGGGGGYNDDNNINFTCFPGIIFKHILISNQV